MEIDPELAKKVLAADLRNVIKKVSDGGTCTASERALLQRAALPAGIANQARVSNLVKKWAAGGRLSADELAEIRALHDTLVAQTETPPDAPSPIAPLVLEPDGPRIAGSRVRYPRPLREYAEELAHDKRTLKRWIDAGKKADPPDLPPLHKPVDLPAWWRRRMKQDVPQSILDAAAQAVSAPAPPSYPDPATPPAEPASAPPPVPPSARDFGEVQGEDLATNVAHLRRTVAIAHQLLDEAQRGTDEAIIASRQRAYRDAFNLLRLCENDLVEYQKSHGDLAPRDVIRSENNRIAGAIFQAVTRLVKNVRPQLANKPPAEQDRIWAAEVLACFATLKAAKFTTFVPDECAA